MNASEIFGFLVQVAEYCFFIAKKTIKKKTQRNSPHNFMQAVAQAAKDAFNEGITGWDYEVPEKEYICIHIKLKSQNSIYFDLYRKVQDFPVPNTESFTICVAKSRMAWNKKHPGPYSEIFWVSCKP